MRRTTVARPAPWRTKGARPKISTVRSNHLGGMAWRATPSEHDADHGEADVVDGEGHGAEAAEDGQGGWRRRASGRRSR